MSANDLVFHADDLPPGQFGLLFYGAITTNVPFGDGVRCIALPLYRFDVQAIDPAGAANRTLELSCLLLEGVSLGRVVRFEGVDTEVDDLELLRPGKVGGDAVDGLRQRDRIGTGKG